MKLRLIYKDGRETEVDIAYHNINYDRLLSWKERIPGSENLPYDQRYVHGEESLDNLKSYRIIKSNSDYRYDHFFELKSRMIDIYHSAKHFKSKDTDIQERMHKCIYNDPWYKKIGTYYVGYLAGVQERLFQELYQYLEFVYKRPDGTLVKSKDLKGDENKEAIHWERAYVWAEDWTKNFGPFTSPDM
jgi:hypothetical protein